MKKLNLYIISLILLAFAACDNEFESEFDLSPDERASEAVKEFKEALCSSEYGWLTHYYANPGLLGSFTYVLKFEETGTVNMNWDLYDYPDQAEYSVKMFEKPVLVFDTYSKFSKMTDPEIGEPGKGFGGENEFGFIRKSADGDTLYLEERVNKDPIVLVRAKADTWNEIKDYAQHAEHLARRNEQVVPFYFNLSVDGWDFSVNMTYNDDRLIAYLSYNENGEAKRLMMPVNFTHKGFEFHHPLVFNGISVRSFKYDAAKKQFDVVDNGVTGAFKYEETSPVHIEGMVQKFFGPKVFDRLTSYFSPKLSGLVGDLRSDGALCTFLSYDPYVASWDRVLKLNFDDWSGLTFIIDDFVGVSEDVVVIKSSAYELGYSAPFDTQEGIDAAMSTPGGMEFKRLLIDSKGWTIVPVYLTDYGSTYYLVSNEDPEIYMFFS